MDIACDVNIQELPAIEDGYINEDTWCKFNWPAKEFKC